VFLEIRVDVDEDGFCTWTVKDDQPDREPVTHDGDVDDMAVDIAAEAHVFASRYEAVA
jgi:hypothetical protein